MTEATTPNRSVREATGSGLKTDTSIDINTYLPDGQVRDVV